MHYSAELLHLIFLILTLILSHFQIIIFYCSVCMALFAIFIREREGTCLHLISLIVNAVVHHQLVHSHFRMSLDIWRTRATLMHPMAVSIRYHCFLNSSVSDVRNEHC